MTNIWTWNYLMVGALCVLITGILIPQILLIAYRKKLFDEPDERKVHHLPIPRLGGLAFAPAIFLSISICLAINLVLGEQVMIERFLLDPMRMIGLFCGIQVMYLLGMSDDMVGVRYRAKFVVQFSVAILMILCGVSLDGLDGILGVESMPVWVAAPLSCLTIVFLINSVNLIDGIDGLASGLSMIAGLTYGLTYAFKGYALMALISFAATGVLVPFFYYNVFGNPKKHEKTFMGDSGSLTIGLIMTFLGIELFSLPSADAKDQSLNCVIAYSPFIIPAFDVFRVYLLRLRNGVSPFLPDKHHIHHKLMALGMTQRQAMVCIVSCSLGLLLLNLAVLNFINITLTVVLDIVLWTTVNVLIDRGIKKRGAA